MTFGSLFAGIGGFDLGFERAGLQCKWQVEINPFCRAVLEKHWPEVRRWNDVTKFCRRLYDCEPEDEEGNCWCNRCDCDFGDCECVGTDALLDECGSVDLICWRVSLPARQLEPERRRLKMMSGGCGPKCPVSFASLGLNGSSWKTSQASLLGGWVTFCATWPASGMTRGCQSERSPESSASITKE